MPLTLGRGNARSPLPLPLEPRACPLVRESAGSLLLQAAPASPLASWPCFSWGTDRCSHIGVCCSAVHPHQQSNGQMTQLLTWVNSAQPSGDRPWGGVAFAHVLPWGSDLLSVLLHCPLPSLQEGVSMMPLESE